MAATFRHLQVRTVRFDTAMVTLAVIAGVTSDDEGLELRGRLTGPRCRFAETIQIAYPLKLRLRSNGRLTYQTHIAEPNLWSPTTPFLYTGNVELWQGETCLDRSAVSHGILQLHLSPRGLRLNGKPLRLRAAVRSSLELQAGLELRERGCNAVILQTLEPLPCLACADEVGLFILWEAPAAVDEAVLLRAATHASFAAAVVTEAAAVQHARRAGAPLIGWWANEHRATPEGVDFHLCRSRQEVDGKPALVLDGGEGEQVIGEMVE
jgi:hypothetical protein